MIISIASRKGSPGVTSLTSLLAWCWPDQDQRRLILEADPSGGSLAARWNTSLGVTLDPGLIDLSASQTRLDEDSLGMVSQPLSDQLRIVAAPPAPHQTSAALSGLGDRGAARLSAMADLVVFADVGRLNAASPALPLARRSAVTLLMCRPTLDEVQVLAPAVSELANAGCALGLVCVGSSPYDPAEVAERLALPLFGTIADDASAAASLNSDGFSARSLRRSRLARSGADVASTVHARTARAFDAAITASSVEAVTEPDDVEPPATDAMSTSSRGSGQ